MEHQASEAVTAPFRLVELREFLRARRREIDPCAVGLPVPHRRRTVGLRLQDVAELADVSVSWYASFEMGHEDTVLPRTLEAVARALQLSRPEKAYLFRITRTPEPVQLPAGEQPVDRCIQELIDGYRDSPVLVTNRRYDIVAFNEAARHFGLAPLGEDDKNLFWRFFHVPIYRDHNGERWELQARRMVGVLRRLYAESAGDELLESLIANLKATSSDFASFWADQTISSPGGSDIEFSVPNAGVIRWRTVILSGEGVSITYFVPRDAASRRLVCRYLEAPRRESK
jgi:hypothetical protein